jgi:hypothetical protein
MFTEQQAALSGRSLRYLLTIVLTDAGRPMRLAELVDAVHRAGFAIAGRESKTVSDALRWEVSKGRVRRAGRSVYRAGWMPRSTAWWIREQVRNLR